MSVFKDYRAASRKQLDVMQSMIKKREMNKLTDNDPILAQTLREEIIAEMSSYLDRMDLVPSMSEDSSVMLDMLEVLMEGKGPPTYTTS